MGLQKKYWGILLGLLFVGIAFVVSTKSYQASTEQEDGSRVYVPVIQKVFPVRNSLGIVMERTTPSGGLDRMIEAGATWTRNSVLWANVEPNKGERNWSALTVREEDWINAAKNDITTIAIVQFAPSWAQAIPGSLCGPIKTDELPAFGSFMYDLVARYSAPPYNIRYWEIWNEPDIDPAIVPGDSGWGCWGDPNDPYFGGGQYAEVLKIVYPQIKSADPQAQVLVGGLLMECDPNNPPLLNRVPRNCVGSRYLEGVLLNGGAPYFDGVSFHAYDFYAPTGQYANSNWDSVWNTTGPVQNVKAAYLRSVLDNPAYNASDKYLINTEVALLCDECENNADFEATKAIYVPQAYAISVAEGYRTNLWYTLLGWRNSGLLNPDLTPKPGYEAFRFFQRQSQNAAAFTRLSLFQNLELYEMTHNNRRIWLMWSRNGVIQTIQLPQNPSQIWDHLGNSLTVAQSIDVGFAPIYVEFTP